MSGQARAVFLDRDGVLNRTVVRKGRPYPPRGLDEVAILPGVAEACQRLREAGFLLIGVTNQPDIARGTTAAETVAEINGYLRAELAIDDFCVCPHDDQDGCACRKPRPGLLLAAAEKWSIELAQSVMVGDRWRDVEAGQRAGCRTVFIDYAYDERRPVGMNVRVTSLEEASHWILAGVNKELDCHV